MRFLRLGVAGLIFVVIILSIALLRVEAAEWPLGWSSPRMAGITVWHHGHRTTSDVSGGIWFAFTEHEEGSLGIRVKRFALDKLEPLVDIRSPVEHSLRNYALTTHGNNAWLAWIERQEGITSTLWLAEVKADGSVTKHLVWRSSAFADGPEMYADTQGRLFLAFTASSGGMAAVQLICWDTAQKKAVLELQLTDGKALAQHPAIVADSSHLHLVYLSQHHVETYAIYQRHAYDGELTHSLNLGLVPQDHRLVPTMMLANDGAMHMVWQSFTGIGDRVAAGAPTYAVIRDGDLEIGPMSVTGNHRGRVSGVRAGLGDDGVVLLSWAAESGSLWQVYAVELGAAGHVLSSGLATLAASNIVRPHPIRIGDTNVISFAQIQPSGMAEVSFVITDTTRKESLAFRMGLDVHSPWMDAAYKFATLFFGAIGTSFAVSASLVVALVVVYVLSILMPHPQTKLGVWLRYGVLFSSLMVLKRAGNPLYFGALVLPGWSALMSWLGAAVFSTSAIVLSNMELDDLVTYGTAGLAFIFCDTFVSMYVLGAGRW